MTDRLKQNLIETSAIGRLSKQTITAYDQLELEHGVTRPEGSAANKVLREYTIQKMQAAGLKIQIDRVGNIIGQKAGTDDRAKVIMIGSHLDSVVNGGHLDGTLGVLAGIEAVHRLDDEGFRHSHPIEVVAFTSEEGSCFEVGTMLGSAVLSGRMSAEEALSIRDNRGETLESVLKRIGFNGTFEHPRDNIKAFLEMHVEQGPVLDNEQIPIGIVESIAGITWLKATITGMENHAGTTPMHLRSDALVAAADAVTHLHKQACLMSRDRDTSIVGTTGYLKTHPNNINVIPGKVMLGFDIRDASLKNMQQLTADIKAYLGRLQDTYNVQVSIEPADVEAPIKLSEKIIGIIESSAIQTRTVYRKMPSGAGHDSMNMTAVADTGMIFVPSVNGISHSPLEWTRWEDIEKGVCVLTAVLKVLSKGAKRI